MMFWDKFLKDIDLKKKKDESVSPVYGNQGILKKLTGSFANCCFATYSFAIAVGWDPTWMRAFSGCISCKKLTCKFFYTYHPLPVWGTGPSTQLVYTSPRIHWLLISRRWMNSSLLKWVQCWQRGGFFMFIHQLCKLVGIIRDIFINDKRLTGEKSLRETESA